MDYRFAELLQSIYEKITTTIRLHEETEKFPVRRGVRQRHSLSPKLFITIMQDLFYNLSWDEKGN